MPAAQRGCSRPPPPRGRCPARASWTAVWLSDPLTRQFPLGEPSPKQLLDMHAGSWLPDHRGLAITAKPKPAGQGLQATSISHNTRTSNKRRARESTGLWSRAGGGNARRAVEEVRVRRGRSMKTSCKPRAERKQRGQRSKKQPKVSSGPL